MKKVLDWFEKKSPNAVMVCLLILMFIVAFSPPARLVWADPGDVQIIITIKAADVAIAKAGILREHPVPTIDDPLHNDPNTPPEKIPTYTDKAWITKLARDYLMREFRSGMAKLRADAANDPNPLQ